MNEMLKSRVYLVTSIVTVVFGTVKGRQDICIDGCSAHRLRGISLPLYDFPHHIAILQNGSGIVAVFHGENEGMMWIPTQGNWTNIITYHSGGQFCVSVEGMSKKMCHDSEDDVILRANPATEVLWKFDCDGASCGCRHYLFNNIGFGPQDLPTKLYFRPEKIAYQLSILGDELLNITVKMQPNWYDLAINNVLNEDGETAFSVSSHSLDIGNVTLTGSDGLWLFPRNGEVMVKTRFGLGCEEEPRGIMKSKQESCTNGCPANRFRGVLLPLYDFPHRISLWQYESGLIVAFSEESGESMWVPTEGWTNISTYHYGGQYCVEVEGVSEKKLCHHFEEKVVLRTLVGQESFWKFDCHGASCGCREHLVHGIEFGAEDLPTKLYFKPENETKELLLVQHLYLTKVNLPERPNWHDITIDYLLDEAGGGAFVVNSRSLELRNWILNSSESIYLLAGSGELSASYRIGLGCEEAPETSSNNTEEIHQDRMWKCISKDSSWAPGLILFAVPVIILMFWRLEKREKTHGEDRLRETLELEETPREDSTADDTV